MKNSVPSGLSKEAKTWWRKIVAGYEFEDADFLILGSALQAFDRMRQAQRILKTEGIVTLDRFKQPKLHPATLIERDSRSAMLHAFRQLNLDVEPLREAAGRPPGGRV